MTDVKFNIYYSTNENGPWTLSNGAPVDHTPGELQQYVVSGLTQDGTYYFSIIGGVMDGSTFIPLISQSIGTSSIGAKGINAAILEPISVNAFIPRSIGYSSLGQMFDVHAITDDTFGQTFELDVVTFDDDTFGQQFEITGIVVDDILGQEFEMNSVTADDILGQEFTVSGVSWVEGTDYTPTFDHNGAAGLIYNTVSGYWLALRS